MNKNLLFRSIPKVDILLEEQEIQDLIDAYGRELVMDVIREEMDALRTFIGKCEEEEKAKAQIGMLTQNIKRHAGKLHEPNMKMVINGTGTVLHTNLGRAPISKEHVERLAGIVSGYSNLEYNLEAGARGERYSHFEKLLCKLTGAEAAMAVNNNAAAVMLILSKCASKRLSVRGCFYSGWMIPASGSAITRCLVTSCASAASGNWRRSCRKSTVPPQKAGWPRDFPAKRFIMRWRQAMR